VFWQGNSAAEAVRNRAGTPLGAISRLDHALDRFEDGQRQYRRRLEEAERRLVSYRARDGGTICFADELADKRWQLRNIEATFRADIDPVESQAPAA
jgi:hypothetical protein